MAMIPNGLRVSRVEELLEKIDESMCADDHVATLNWCASLEALLRCQSTAEYPVGLLPGGLVVDRTYAGGKLVPPAPPKPDDGNVH